MTLGQKETSFTRSPVNKEHTGGRRRGEGKKDVPRVWVLLKS